MALHIEPIDGDVLRAAATFLAGHGRPLDRRRLRHLLGDGDPDGVLAALDAYRNSDGGYGWGLESDLRSPESQPTAVMHAFEVIAELPPTAATTDRAIEACDWLTTVTLPDGGLPFTVPVTDPAGCAPLWLGADQSRSSLQMTAQVVATALAVARDRPAVAEHPWLRTATDWCLAAVLEVTEEVGAHELLFAVRFADAYARAGHDASRLFEHLGAHIPADGIVAVQGGVEGEALRPLDFAPLADSAARSLFTEDAIADDLARLRGDQQADGGWVVDFASASPAASLEWRSYATVQAVRTLLSYAPPARA